MAYKIIKNHTLEEYNKKYGDKNLKKVSFLDAKKSPSLLDNKSWWLIDDTYYEISKNKNPLVGWWSNLRKVTKIAICSVAGAGVTTAVVVPTVIAINNKNSTKREVEIESGVQHIKNCTLTEVGDNLEISFAVDDGYEVYGIEKITINGKAFTDFKFENGRVIISKSALKDYTGKIVVSPKIKEKTPEPSVETIELENISEGETAEYGVRNINLTPSKTYMIKANVVDSFKIDTCIFEKEDGETWIDPLTIFDSCVAKCDDKTLNNVDIRDEFLYFDFQPGAKEATLISGLVTLQFTVKSDFNEHNIIIEYIAAQ